MVSTARLFGLQRRRTDRQKKGGMDKQTDREGNAGFNQIYAHWNQRMAPK